jgi:hypothetical protein
MQLRKPLLLKRNHSSFKQASIVPLLHHIHLANAAELIQQLCGEMPDGKILLRSLGLQNKVLFQGLLARQMARDSNIQTIFCAKD